MEEVTKRFDTLKNERASLEHYWIDAYNYTAPHRSLGYHTSSNLSIAQVSASLAKNSKIFDSTAADGAKLLAKSLKSGLVPSSSEWFSLAFETGTIGKIDKESTQWLQQAASKLFTMIHSSNFDKEIIDALLDLVICGMFALFVTKKENGPLDFEAWLPSTLMIEDTLGEGIDTIYRQLVMTAQQIVHKWGSKNLSQEIKEAFNNNSTKTFEIIHTIRPRMKNGKVAKGNKATDMPWESIYVARTGNVKLNESGFKSFPIIIPRWTKISGTEYPVGPVNDVLPDVKSVNKIVELNMLASEMSIFGIFVAGPGVVNGKTFRVQPRTVNVVSDIQRFKAIQSPGNSQVASSEIVRMQKQIKTGLMSDQLSPMEKNYASATEVLDRAKIIRQLLGADYARLQNEFLEKLIQRVFQLSYSDGSLGQAPEGVLNSSFVPVYKSPLAKTQKLEDLTELDRFEATLANQAQINPSVLDLYDQDEALRLRFDLEGLPVQLLRSKQQVEQLRQQQAEQQQAMVEQQAAMQNNGEIKTA